MIMVSGISRWGSVGAYLNDVFLPEAGVLEGKDDPLWSLTSKRFPVLVFWGGSWLVGRAERSFGEFVRETGGRETCVERILVP